MLKSTKHDSANIRKKKSKTLDLFISLILFPLDFIFCALVFNLRVIFMYNQIAKNCLKSLAFCNSVNNLDEQSTSLGEFSYAEAGVTSTLTVCTRNCTCDGLCLYT